MSFDDLIVLIPSHSLEDFPTELTEEQAASLLNAFAIAWHPALLASARLIPSWHRSDEPPDVVKNRLVIEGKYEGIVDGLPVFISTDTNTPIDFKPEEFIKITNDDGDIILTQEEFNLYLLELDKQEWYIVACCGVVAVAILLYIAWLRMWAAFASTSI